MNFTASRGVAMAVAAMVALTGMTGAAAAAWPERTITFVVPFPAGGSSDIIARAVAQETATRLGGSIIVENRPGATGAIGAAAVKNAPADGYTILVASIGTYATNPFLQPKLAYDPLNDFDLITVAVRSPNMLVAAPKFSGNTTADLVEMMKKSPGKVTFANSGVGSSDHLTAALFWQRTGAPGLHVPYRGGAPAVNDLMGGHVDVSFQNLSTVSGQLQSGALRAMAITSKERSPLMPNVPTLKEQGVDGVDVYSWQAIAAPKGLPKDVKDKLVGAILESLKSPTMKQRMNDIGFEVVANTPDEFRVFLVEELARWKQVIETGKITIE